jgi:hypothetical protein
MDSLAPRIVHLRSQLISEFKSELIEFQKGKIKAIEFKQIDDLKSSTDLANARDTHQ